MALLRAQQDQIQALIDASDAVERRGLAVHAELALRRLSAMAKQHALKEYETADFYYAVEVLVRLEATDAGKGAWFRSKRRLQLTREFLKP